MTTATTKHAHEPAADKSRRPYTGPVTRDENPAAHGCIRLTEACACGATREVNVNGRHREEGAWTQAAKA